MMLLRPLGLLGLLGLIALLLIYIIKPNYQQKTISSTFIWKLSLKYRKKKLPINKWRNILLILCQIFILVCSAAILTQPMAVLKTESKVPEIVAIIDSSASMRTVSKSGSRFDRALGLVQAKAEETLEENGIVHVIVADDKPEFLERNIRVEKQADLTEALSALKQNNACGYGKSDMESAITLCEEVTKVNPNTKIYLYTDTEYAYLPSGVTAVPVYDTDEEGRKTEWNAAILDVSTELADGHYSFIVDLACYGRSKEIDVVVEVQKPNVSADSTGVVLPKTLTATVPCDMDKPQRVVFINSDKYVASNDDMEGFFYVPIESKDWVSSYESVLVYLEEADSFTDDNKFNLYDGTKQTLRVYYASSIPNPFFLGMLDTLEVFYKDRWNVIVEERGERDEIQTEGKDLYIFEHEMPENMPTDGVVFLVNPQTEIVGSGVRPIAPQPFKDQVEVMKELEHPLLKNMNVSNILLTEFMTGQYAPDYVPLLSCAGSPVLLIKEEVDSKVVVLPFSLHYSTFPLEKEFPLFMLNFFEYFFPATVNGNAFEISEEITLNARGDMLSVSLGATTPIATFNKFPATLTVQLPGTYFLTQSVFSNDPITEKIYVRIPATESDIFAEGDMLPNPYSEVDTSGYYQDLLLIFAAVLVGLLFAEWWLQSRENM